MSRTTNSVDLQEQLSRLSRAESGIRDESTLVAATGAMAAAWTIKVLSLDSYNRYNVEQVRITAVGISPGPVGGSETKAFNVAEPFDQTGSVSAGTYAVMWRAGDKNVFYVKP